jgi:hypothetical protein
MAKSSNGFIALDRNLQFWRWYTDANTMRMWIHILLICNWKTGYVGKLKIEPGQCLSSYGSLAKALKMSTSQARTSINHLVDTGELTTKIAPKGIIITAVNWEKFQMLEKTSQATSQAKRKKIAGKSQATSQPNRNNRTKITKVLTKEPKYLDDDDRERTLKKIYSVGFDDDPDADELSELERIATENDYSSLLLALKQTRKHKGKGIAYTARVIKNRKAKIKPFNPERDISKIKDTVIENIADHDAADQICSSAEDLKQFYTDMELLEALRSCVVYPGSDNAEAFAKEVRTGYLEKESGLYDAK